MKFNERFQQENDSCLKKEEIKYEERKNSFFAEYKKVKRAYVIKKLKKQYDSQTQNDQEVARPRARDR